eukprot:PhM_4_TR10751/c0_g1_i1/m.56601
MRGLFIAAACIIAVCVGSVSATLPKTQIDALRALYTATGGDDWYPNGWQNATSDPCTQYDGVLCNDAHTSVVEVSVSNNNLVGAIPSAFFAGLPDLSLVDLRQNPGITGPIPDNAFGTVTSLSVTFSTSCAIPASLSNATQLEHLELSATAAVAGSGAPIPALDKLVSLKTFEVTNGMVSGTIPDSVCKLTMLESFNVGGNNLTGSVPVCMSNPGAMARLSMVDVSDNALTGLLPDVTQWSPYRVLAAGNNQFSGAVPASYANLCGRGEWVVQATGNKLACPYPAFVTSSNCSNVFMFDPCV